MQHADVSSVYSGTVTAAHHPKPHIEPREKPP
jgi:hypothetical protein